MDSHRLVRPRTIACISAVPFSCFDYVEREFGYQSAVHRCFSLARSMEFDTLIVEDIPPIGIIQDENDEIVAGFPDYSMEALKRLSFWRDPNQSIKGIDSILSDGILCGYAIVKRDVTSSARTRSPWHVFEAVFPKYGHPHNCVPKQPEYRVNIGDRECPVAGVLYCQQNGLNKACAQVALRSLLSRRLPGGDLPYRTMNEIAAKESANFAIGKGLHPGQIRAILSHFGIPYRDIQYRSDDDSRMTHPYQKYVYAGVESGSGALVGFHYSGPKASKNANHIIPFFGHTFNKDTWAPDAEISYFNVGADMRYIPSESWTSSFLGHDDNLGPNFCIPRLYLKPELVDYVAEILPARYQISGVAAEAKALQFLDSIQPKLRDRADNAWMRRLHATIESQCIVLRALALSKDVYREWLRSTRDWEGHSESVQNLAVVDLLPDDLWAVEISVPHLFPANERKLGEIIMNAGIPDDPGKAFTDNQFFLCRLPGHYFMVEGLFEGQPIFADMPTPLISHTPLFRS